MISANISTIDHAISGLTGAIMLPGSSMTMQPNLAGYSQVPSLQLVATEHSLAISGSSGSSAAVGLSLGKQLTWAQTNLADFRRVITEHESTMNRILRSINPFNGDGASVAEVARTSGVFQRRPMFEAGSLTFAPVTLSAELGLDAKSLLSMFSSTNDGAVAEAIAYWNNFAETMTTLASNLTSISSGLVSSNSGAVFSAADTTMKGLAARATSIATASEVMAGHLAVLPSVKAMAVNALSAIEAESKALPTPGAQKAFEQAEVAAFLSGPYTAQLQTAIPRIPNLVSADAGSGVTAEVSVGATVAGRSGTSQFSLSPAGMTGSMQAASTPVGATSTVPDSPTPQSTSASPSAPSHVQPSTSTLSNPTNPSAAPVHPAPPSSPTSSTISPTSPTGTSTMAQPSTANPAMVTPSGASAPLQRTSPQGVSPYGVHGNRPAGPLGAGRTAGLTPAGNIPALPPSGNASPRPPASGLPTSSPGRMPAPTAGRGMGTGLGPGIAGSALPNASNSPAQRGSGLMNSLISARNSTATGATGTAGGTTGAAAGNRGAGAFAATTAGSRGGLLQKGSAPSARKLTNVATIRDNDAGAFEQNEYQKELFGDAPITIPAVIGHNVRS
ncbi:hypothetical protein [Corynebacterium amycolatum]|uniref:hypothetical protein n=1 Tax=Corynebacterium amycolatum TaxID=43765 RepID=UPI00234D53D0|nr:hypothetical protein [Corynebacterium amycolatum]MDC7116062.1 hypothetical protein [Corynebacterium amycolatum]